MIALKEISKESAAYKILNGPGVNGSVKDGYARVVKPGDIIIIPPDVFHGWVSTI
jgi:quercetin dioxygenase-like cupin family protein